mgnify:CR=1 FL=1
MLQRTHCSGMATSEDNEWQAYRWRLFWIKDSRTNFAKSGTSACSMCSAFSRSKSMQIHSIGISRTLGALPSCASCALLRTIDLIQPRWTSLLLYRLRRPRPRRCSLLLRMAPDRSTRIDSIRSFPLSVFIVQKHSAGERRTPRTHAEGLHG